jgi:amino acid transporter
MMQSSGGEHPYLLRTYGKLPAFLYSWSACIVGKAGSGAIILLVFAEYLCKLVAGLVVANGDLSTPPIWIVKLVAISGAIVLATVNSVSIGAGTLVQNVSTGLKLLAISAIAISGIFILATSEDLAENFKNPWENTETNVGNYALAMYQGLAQWRP